MQCSKIHANLRTNPVPMPADRGHAAGKMPWSVYSRLFMNMFILVLTAFPLMSPVFFSIKLLIAKDNNKSIRPLLAKRDTAVL